MKSKKVGSKLFNVCWRLGIAFILLTAFSYAVIQGLTGITDNHPQTLAPARSIRADRPLSARIFFNNAVGGNAAFGVLKDQIAKARHTIEIAVFSFAATDLKEALLAADKRGVRVTLVLDKSMSGQHDVFLGDLPSTIARIDAGSFDPADSTGTVYMHDKFMIIDRGYPGAEMTTGSLNFTTLGEEFNQSFMLSTADPDIISVYGAEFDRLKKDISGIRKLGDPAYDPWAATIGYTDGSLEIWFSPGFSSRSVRTKILSHIASSKASIDIMMWDLTDWQIASALAKKAQEGVAIRIITNAKNASSKDSLVPYLQAMKINPGSGKLEVIFDDKLKKEATKTLPPDFVPFIHHHSMIVDGKTLVLGSGNWSLWGFYNNDENTLITDNAHLVQESQKTFDHFLGILR